MDWADEIEIKIADEYGSHGAVLAADADGMIAAALRKAKADGMREAAETAENCEVTLDGDDPFGNRQIASAIRFRASQIEKVQA